MSSFLHLVPPFSFPILASFNMVMQVKSEQGLKMIKIFKDHSSKTCLLDDFEFYEARQKTIQENKAKQQIRKQARFLPFSPISYPYLVVLVLCVFGFLSFQGFLTIFHMLKLLLFSYCSFYN